MIDGKHAINEWLAKSDIKHVPQNLARPLSEVFYARRIADLPGASYRKEMERSSAMSGLVGC